MKLRGGRRVTSTVSSVFLVGKDKHSDMTNAGETVASKLAALHDRYYERLLPIARKLCKGAPGIDPGDLVQESLMRYLEHFEGARSERGDEPVEGWLIAVLTRCFIDQVRKAMSRKKAEDDPTITRYTLGQGEALPTYERITPERFARAVELLPAKQRVTFLLRSQGLGNQEIALRLGVSANVVGKRLSDARQRLRELLQPYVDEGIQ